MTAVSIVRASVAAVRRQTGGPVAAVSESAVLIIASVDATPVPLVVAVASAIGLPVISVNAITVVIWSRMMAVIAALTASLTIVASLPVLTVPSLLISSVAARCVAISLRVSSVTLRVSSIALRMASIASLRMASITQLTSSITLLMTAIALLVPSIALLITSIATMLVPSVAMMVPVTISVAVTMAVTATVTVAVTMAVAVTVAISMLFLIYRSVQRTSQLSARSYRSTSHHSSVPVLAQLDDLVTGEVFSLGSEFLSVAAVFFVASMAMDACAIILIRLPVTIPKMISVARGPRMHALSINLVIGIPVRALFILTIESDSGSLCHLLALSVILDDLPVLLDRNIDVAELDFSLCLLLDLCQLFPLD